MLAQPTVDRSPFRKHGLSPVPLLQAVKSLSCQEIKRQPSKRANRGWEGLRRRKRKGLMVIPTLLPYPAWCPQRGLLPAAAAPTGQAGVQRPTALLETVSVPRLPGRTSRRPRGYSTTRQGLKNTCSVFPPTLCQLEWGAWSKSKDPPSKAPPPHLQREPRSPSNTVHSTIAQRGLVRGKTQAPKALHREEVPWGPV